MGRCWRSGDLCHPLLGAPGKKLEEEVRKEEGEEGQGPTPTPIPTPTVSFLTTQWGGNKKASHHRLERNRRQVGVFASQHVNFNFSSFPSIEAS